MIVYFSATGNSKYCAEKLAQVTEDHLFSLNDAMKNHLEEIDCGNCSQLGFVLPVHDWSLPWAVADYLKTVKFCNLPNDAYIFSVHTCGTTSGANAKRMKELLVSKGLHLDAAFSVFMPVSELVMKQKGGPEKQAQILADADKVLAEIAADIKDRNAVVRMNGTIPAPVQALISKLSLPMRKSVTPFHVNDDCIGCGKCSKVCPQNIIRMEQNRPVWTEDRCMNCFACRHHCPKQAIRHGK